MDESVSVCLITYNQVKYITQAIEGILAQKTDFPFEVIIGDDGSVDGTVQICESYQKKYPSKITLIKRDRKNLHYVDGQPTARRNFWGTLNACRGRYVAYCEGDDYWQDENKLQEQISFLRSNKDYGLVHSVADVYYGGKDRFKRYKGGRIVPEGDVYNNLFYRMNIFSSSICCRGDLLRLGLEEIKQYGNRWRSGDVALWLMMARHSKFHYVDKPYIVYRIVENSLSHKKDLADVIRFRAGGLRVYLHYHQKFGGPKTRAWLYWQAFKAGARDTQKLVEHSVVRRVKTIMRKPAATSQ